MHLAGAVQDECLVHVDRVHARLCGEQAVIVDELNVLGISLASWRKRWNFKRVFKLDVMGKQL